MAVQPFAGVLGRVASRVRLVGLVRLSLTEQLPARARQPRACRKPPAEVIAGARGWVESLWLRSFCTCGLMVLLHQY